MYFAYKRLSAVLGRPDRPAELGARAQLLFGQHEVLVVMDYAEGVECSDAEVTLVDGAIMRGAARAVAWLAKQGVIYTDLRGPNVLKSCTHVAGAAAAGAATAPSVTLIDFDDCVVTAEPVLTLGAYVAALQTYCIEQLTWPLRPLSRTFAEEFVVGEFPLLRKALGDAFTSLAAADA